MAPAHTPRVRGSHAPARLGAPACGLWLGADDLAGSLFPAAVLEPEEPAPDGWDPNTPVILEPLEDLEPLEPDWDLLADRFMPRLARYA